MSDPVAALLAAAAAHQAAGELAAALDCCARAVDLAPQDPEALTALARAERGSGDLDAAIDHFERALAAAPDAEVARLNLAAALDEAGETARALALIDACDRLLAASAPARWLAAPPVLRSGDLARGFALYEARWQLGGAAFAPRHAGTPRWDGAAAPGRSLLLWAEQGLGDTVQFIRFARTAQARGLTVAAEVPRQLAALVAGMPGIAQVHAPDATAPTCDLQLPLMSLPHVLGTTLDGLDGDAYLAAPADRRAKWAGLLPATQARRIGLVWRSTILRDDALVTQSKLAKSLPLAVLAPFATLPATQLVSLQVGHGSEEIAGLPRGFRLADPTAHIDDLADTAAAIERCDLVVTIDTVVAHLAGALGKPVFVLLAHSPCWRWLAGRDDSPWYRAARLFRQTVRNDWRAPVATAAAAARDLPRRPAAGSSAWRRWFGAG
ncbi:MAG: tetratricopeptide repeat protein [Burkholderiales bacterium]|nr:tetratricopeptide repeat protein [Burkholderiales bacterium]